MPPIDPALLDRRIDGLGLTSATLAGELKGEPVLLVFLRHFG